MSVYQNTIVTKGNEVRSHLLPDASSANSKDEQEHLILLKWKNVDLWLKTNEKPTHNSQ